MTLEQAIDILEMRLKEGSAAYKKALYEFERKFPDLYQQFENSPYYDVFDEIAK